MAPCNQKSPPSSRCICCCDSRCCSVGAPVSPSPSALLPLLARPAPWLPWLLTAGLLPVPLLLPAAALACLLAAGSVLLPKLALPLPPRDVRPKLALPLLPGPAPPRLPAPMPRAAAVSAVAPAAATVPATVLAALPTAASTADSTAAAAPASSARGSPTSTFCVPSSPVGLPRHTAASREPITLCMQAAWEWEVGWMEPVGGRHGQG